MKMLQTVVIGLCVIVGVLTKVIPITNICESQDGVLRCSYSGEGQYISLQDLNNIREIRFERFFQPSTLFIENAKQLRQIIIQSGSTQCEDISCDNPKVLISIAGIPCQSSKFTTSSITYTTSEPASSHQTERPITSTTSTPPSTLSLQSVLLVVFEIILCALYAFRPQLANNIQRFYELLFPNRPLRHQPININQQPININQRPRRRRQHQPRVRNLPLKARNQPDRLMYY
ncbi:uncharacterized protein LOC134718566 isoform X1 [Mytilus trossulus]|uniref:uncharacterized protein LOC134718566 isoform X1 n=1 Tax=Mytilus trossulus TaxID=6551 RepID=UPI003006972E